MFPSQDDMEPNQKDQKYGAHIVDHHVQIAESMYHPGSDERQGIVYDNRPLQGFQPDPTDVLILIGFPGKYHE